MVLWKALCSVSSGSGNSRTSQTWETGGGCFSAHMCLWPQRGSFFIMAIYYLQSTAGVHGILWDAQTRSLPRAPWGFIQRVICLSWAVGRQSKQGWRAGQVSQMSGWSEEFLMRKCKWGKADVSDSKHYFRIQRRFSYVLCFGPGKRNDCVYALEQPGEE